MGRDDPDPSRIDPSFRISTYLTLLEALSKPNRVHFAILLGKVAMP